MQFITLLALAGLTAATVPQDLSGGYKKDKYNLYVSYDNQYDHGKQDGHKYDQKTVMYKPSYYVNKDNYHGEDKQKFVLVVLDTTQEGNYYMHYAQHDYQVNQQYQLQSSGSGGYGYWPPGYLGEDQGNRWYSYMMYEQPDNFNYKNLPQLGEKVDVGSWREGCGLEKAVAGISIQVEVKEVNKGYNQYKNQYNQYQGYKNYYEYMPQYNQYSQGYNQDYKYDQGYDQGYKQQYEQSYKDDQQYNQYNQYGQQYGDDKYQQGGDYNQYQQEGGDYNQYQQGGDYNQYQQGGDYNQYQQYTTSKYEQQYNTYQAPQYTQPPQYTQAPPAPAPQEPAPAPAPQEPAPAPPAPAPPTVSQIGDGQPQAPAAAAPFPTQGFSTQPLGVAQSTGVPTVAAPAPSIGVGAGNSLSERARAVAIAGAGLAGFAALML